MNEDKTNINWYPGHMAKAEREMKETLSLIDIIIEVRDARLPITSKSSINYNKPRIVIYTKSDLSDIERTASLIDDSYYIVTSLNDFKIKDKVEKMSYEIMSDKLKTNNDKGLINKKLRLMVMGIPNTGKSTLINRMAGKKSLRVGNTPGVTKGLNWLNLSDNLSLLDTPGIMPKKFNSKEEYLKLALCSMINEDIIDYYEVINYLYDYFKDRNDKYFLDYYKLDKYNNFYDDLYLISKNKGYLLKGGEVDTDRGTMGIYQDFKKDRLGKVTLD